MSFPQTITASQANKETPISEMFASLKWASAYTNDQPNNSGLARAYNGGRWGGFDVADVVHTFGAGVTTYVCVTVATGVLDFSTSNTNYLNTASFAPVETVVTSASAVTSTTDDRTAAGGVWNRSAAAGIGDMVLSSVQTVTGEKTFGAPGAVGKLKIAGTTSGAATLDAPAVAGSIVITLPATTGTLALVGDITTAINAVIASAPGALDTLDELAAALGDDANFAATLATTLAGKAPLASPALTGTPTTPTASLGTGGTQIASQAYADAAAAAAASAGGADTVTALAIVAGVVDIDCALGDYFTLALSANVTSITFSNLPGAGKGASKWIEIVQGGGYTVAWPASFKWAGGSAGAVSATSATDELGITTVNNGTSWKATLGKAFA